MLFVIYLVIDANTPCEVRMLTESTRRTASQEEQHCQPSRAFLSAFR